MIRNTHGTITAALRWSGKKVPSSQQAFAWCQRRPPNTTDLSGVRRAWACDLGFRWASGDSSRAFWLREGLLVGVWVSSPCPSQEPLCFLICLRLLVQAGHLRSPDAGTPAGTVVLPVSGLRVHGGTVTAGGAVPQAGELAVFCRPVVTAPAVARRDGSVLAGSVAPGLRAAGQAGASPGRRGDRGGRGHGDRGGVAEEAAAAADHVVSAGHPADDRDGADAGRLVLRGADPPGRGARGHPVHPGMACPDGEGGHAMAAAIAGRRDGGPVLGGGRAAHRR